MQPLPFCPARLLARFLQKFQSFLQTYRTFFSQPKTQHTTTENYNALLERISKASGLNISDLDRRVEAKRAKLSGLISKEGAAQIVASELGISFNNQRMKISELVHGMKKVKGVI